MSSDNTFPEFSLKIMFISSIRRYFNSGDGIILGYVMIPGWNSFVPCSTLQILWSACGQQTWIVSKSTHEWLRVTASDHEWPRVTTSDHEWPRVTTSDHEWDCIKIFCWCYDDVIITSFYQIITISRQTGSFLRPEYLDSTFSPFLTEWGRG